jgi:hypothetical protein
MNERRRQMLVYKDPVHMSGYRIFFEGRLLAAAARHHLRVAQ